MGGPAAARLDETAMAPYLGAHVAGFQGPLIAKKFGDGQSNPTFRLDAASGPYVLPGVGEIPGTNVSTDSDAHIVTCGLNVAY